MVMGYTERELIPDQCRICEAGCYAMTQCNPDFCLGANVGIIAVFGLLGIPIFVRLIQFFRQDPAGWSLKKIIYIMGSLTCADRILRYGLMLGEVQTMGRVGRWFDLIFYWAGIYLLVAMYSTLLLFWANVCRSNGTPRTWLSDNMKRILIAVNVFVFACLIGAFPAVNVLLDTGTGNAIVNGLIGLTLLALAISYLVEGIKLHRLIKSFAVAKSTRTEKTSDQQSSLLTAITITVIGTSAAVIIALFVLAIGSLISSKFDYNKCQVMYMVYRSVEVAVLLFIVVPLRRVRKATENSSNPTATTKRSVNSDSPNYVDENSRKDHSSSDQVEVNLNDSFASLPEVPILPKEEDVEMVEVTAYQTYVA